MVGDSVEEYVNIDTHGSGFFSLWDALLQYASNTDISVMTAFYEELRHVFTVRRSISHQIVDDD
jgi:hypothetical protein